MKPRDDRAFCSPQMFAVNTVKPVDNIELFYIFPKLFLKNKYCIPQNMRHREHILHFYCSSQDPAKESISQHRLMSDIQGGCFTCPVIVLKVLTDFAAFAYIICTINSYQIHQSRRDSISPRAWTVGSINTCGMRTDSICKMKPTGGW